MNKTTLLLTLLAILAPDYLYADAGIEGSPSSINLGSVNPGIGATATGSICVWSEAPDGEYTVTMTSENSANHIFRMKLLNDNSYINYQVKFKDDLSPSGFVNITHNTPLTEQTTGASSSICDTDNAQVRISVNATQSKTAPAGTFSDVLTLTISEPA